MQAAARPKIFYGWVVVIAALVMNVAASPTNAVSFSFFIAPMHEDLGWSRGELALGLTFRLAVAGVTAPVTGMLVDRIGPRVLGTAAGAIAGTALVGVAFVQELWQFYLLFAFSGLSGFGSPAGQLLTTVPVAKWFYAKRGRALAIASVGMPLGTVIYVPLIQAVINTFDWRTAALVSGLLVACIAIPVSAIFMRKDPEALGLNPDGAESTPDLLAASTPRPSRPLEVDWNLHQALRSRSFWLIIAWIGFSGIILQGALVYRTSYWEDVGIAPGLVAAGTILDPLTVVFSGLFFGVVAERFAIRYVGFVGMLGIACSMLPLLLAWDSPVPLFTHNIVWGFFAGSFITTNNVIWPDYFGRRYLGAIRGFVFPVAVGTAALSPLVFALLASFIEPFRYVWIVALLGFTLSGLMLFSARPPRLRRSAPATLPVEATP